MEKPAIVGLVEDLTQEIMHLSEETEKLTKLRDEIQKQLDSKWNILFTKKNQLNKLNFEQRLFFLEDMTIYQLDRLNYQQLHDLMSQINGHKDIPTPRFERVTENDLIPIYKLYLKDHSCRYCKMVCHMKDSCPKLMKFKCDACGKQGHSIPYCKTRVMDLK